MITPESMRCWSNGARMLLRIALLLFGAVHLTAHATFDERAAWVLENLRGQELGPISVGLADVAVAVARLQADPNDAEALDFITQVRHGGHFFNLPMLAHAYLRFEDSFSTAQRNAVRANVTALDNWNPDYTEDRICLWTSLYLLTQSFPSANWNWEEDGVILSLGSEEARQRAGDKLRAYGRSLFEMGHNEYLSPNYDGWKISFWLNLYDFAEDGEMRSVAAAALLYHTTLLAHASFEEVLMPPYSRGIGSPLSRNISANAQWTMWMLWGVGNVGSANVSPRSTLFFLALTDWRPEPVLAAIARGEAVAPYTFLSEQPHFFSRERGYMRRTTYRDTRFAVSSGVYRFYFEDLDHPGARQLIDDAQFMIVWESARPHRQIMAGDPYWRSTGGGGWGDTSSPFMQTGQHENTAIVLFDIPGEDPWPDLEQWSGSRRDIPIALAQARVPLDADYTMGVDNWHFLEDGGVFIGINALRGGLRNRREMMDIGYATLNSRGIDGERWQAGFLFEVATDDDFGSLADFMAAVYANPLTVDWEAWTVNYTNTRGDTILMAYNPSLEPPDLAMPEVRVNGEKIDYSAWPVMESPFVLLEDHHFRLENPAGRLVVDWSGDYPDFQSHPLPPFEAWLADAGIPLGRRAPGDRHGPLQVTNLQAYAAGVAPQAMTTDDLPRMEIVPAAPESIGFTYRLHSGANDLAAVLETSVDLVHWSTAEPFEETVRWVSGGVEGREARFTVDSASPLFIRLSLDLYSPEP